MNAAAEIAELLGLRNHPVAIRFQESVPEAMERIDQQAVSGCTYWKLAAEGRSFYTEASDHFGCPVGAHTHGVELPDEQSRELEGLVGTMVQLEYLREEEVATIPRRSQAFRFAIYAPATDASLEPDVVLLHGSAKQMMMLVEAAHAAGIRTDGSLIGRPTCAAIPAVVESGVTVTNLGCIGNRVYTELGDDELYFVIAGAQVEPIVERLRTIVNANQQLDQFHRARLTA